MKIKLLTSIAVLYFVFFCTSTILLPRLGIDLCREMYGGFLFLFSIYVAILSILYCYFQFIDVLIKLVVPEKNMLLNKILESINYLTTILLFRKLVRYPWHDVGEKFSWVYHDILNILFVIIYIILISAEYQMRTRLNKKLFLFGGFIPLIYIYFSIQGFVESCSFAFTIIGLDYLISKLVINDKKKSIIKGILFSLITLVYLKFILYSNTNWITFNALIIIIAYFLLHMKRETTSILLTLILVMLLFILNYYFNDKYSSIRVTEPFIMTCTKGSF